MGYSTCVHYRLGKLGEESDIIQPFLLGEESDIIQPFLLGEESDRIQPFLLGEESDRIQQFLLGEESDRMANKQAKMQKQWPISNQTLTCTNMHAK